MSHERIEELARQLVEAVIDTLPSAPTEKERYGVVMAVLRPVFKDVMQLGRLDSRRTLYSARLVLHTATSDDIVNVTPWLHGLHGLSAVWEAVEGLCRDALAPHMPPELTAGELRAREPTVRVSMSRKKNGVAALRVPFKLPKSGASLRPDGPRAMSDMVLRIDVATDEAAKQLEQYEITSGSPLAVQH